MNTENNNYDQDEQDINKLYQGLDQSEPPAHLDAAIKSAARDAVQQHLQHPASPLSGKWLAPVSMAAVIVLAVLVVPLMMEYESNPSTLEIPLQLKQQATLLSKSKTVISEKPAAKTSSSSEKKPEASPAFNYYSILPEEDSAGMALSYDTQSVSKSAMKPAPATVPAVKQSRQLPEHRYMEPVIQSLSWSKEAKEDQAGKKPVQWLEEIKILIELDQIEAARAELKALQERYPDVEIDQEIIDTLIVE